MHVIQMSALQDGEVRDPELPLWIWVCCGAIAGVLGCVANLPDGINDHTGWFDYLVMPPMLIVHFARRFGEGWWNASIYLAVALQVPLFILISLLLRNWKYRQSQNN
jgi:hypothetical protein